MEGATIAPLVLARISCLPPAALDSICLSHLEEEWDAILQAEAEAETVRVSLEEALHRLVPELDHDRNLRRAVLHLKRAAHNAVIPKLPDDILQQVAEHLSEPERLRLQQWMRCQDRRQQARERSALQVREGIKQASHGLKALMSQPDFRKGLVLASKEFTLALCRSNETESWLPASRLSRTGVAYLTRATVKTSPFSTFTQMAVTHLDGPVQAANPTSVCTVRRSLAHALLHALVRDPELVRAFRFERASGTWKTEKGTAVLVPRFQFAGEMFSRLDRPMVFPSNHPLIESVLAFRGGSYDELLRALPPSADHATVIGLISSGLLVPVAPWRIQETAPLRGMAAALKMLADGRATSIGGLLDRVENLVSQFGTADTAMDRLRLADETSAAVSQTWGALKEPVPNWVADTNIICEDVRAPHAVPDLGPHVRDDLQQIASMQRHRFALSKAYDLAIRLFVEEYGAGGTCADVLEFLLSFFLRPDRAQALSEALRADMEALQSGAAPDSLSTATTASPSFGLFFQIAATSYEEILRGNYLMVINQFCDGQGGQFARFSQLFPEPGGMERYLAEWVAQLYPGASASDFPLLADCNNLQVGCPVGVSSIRWPTETPTMDSRDALHIGELRLQHDPVANMIRLIDRLGRPIAPAYLGAIPPHFTSGAVRILLMLTNPWAHLDTFQFGWSRSAPPPDSIQSYPRRQVGRIVLQRARWRIPAAEFPLRKPEEREAEFMYRVHVWRRSHGIPVEVFALAEGAGFTSEARFRKPMWVNLSSLHAMEAARPLIESGAPAISLVEPLPDRKSHWLVGADNQARTTEFLAMVRYDLACQAGD